MDHTKLAIIWSAEDTIVALKRSKSSSARPGKVLEGPRGPPGKATNWNPQVENGPVEIVDFPIKNGDVP